MKKELTIEQKAKRYEYLEDVILAFLDEKIENYKYDNGYDVPAINAVNDWMNEVDVNDDVVPDGLYMLFDKIMDENFGSYISMKNWVLKSKCVRDEYKQKYQKFVEKIGG